MSKKKKRSYRSMTIPLAPIIGLAGGFAGPMGDSPIEYAMKGDWRSCIVRLMKSYTGYDPNVGGWNWEDLKHGLMPLVGGLLIHKFVGGSPLNLNRVLARNKIPLIRI